MSSVQIDDSVIRWGATILITALLGWVGMQLMEVTSMKQNIALIQKDVAQIKETGIEQSQINSKRLNEFELRVRELERTNDRYKR